MRAFLAAMETFTPQEMRDLRTVFDVYDPSKSGHVTLKDFRKILGILGFKCSRHQLQVIIKEEEMGGKEKDTYNFANLLLVVDRLQGNDYDLYDEIRQTFNNLDHDKDGQLSIEDIRKACKQAELGLSKTDIDEMIEEADRNGDGLVSLQEFTDIIKRTALFK